MCLFEYIFTINCVDFILSAKKWSKHLVGVTSQDHFKFVPVLRDQIKLIHVM